MNTSTKISKLRDKMNLSQREVAAQIGMTQPNYHKLESGAIRPKLDTIEKLATFFGVQIEDLRADDDTEGRISQHNHNNENVITANQITVNFTEEEVIAILRKQITDKEEIIRLQAEKITRLEQK